MAKFSSTFLQGLLQPSYQEGLFEAAKGAGQTPMLAIQENKRKEELEQFRSMGPVDQANYMLTRAKTPEEISSAQALKNTAVKTGSQTSVANLELARQEALNAGNTDEAMRIENIMKRVAVDGNLGSAALASITGRTASQIKAQNDAEWVAGERADANRKKLEQQLVEQEASAIAYSNVPISMALENERYAEVPRSTLAKIEEKATALRERRDANLEASTKGVLKPAHIKALKETPEIANLPEVEEALRVLNKEEAAPWERRNAVKTITNLLDKDAEREFNLKYGKENRKGQAVRAVDYVTGLKSRSTGPVYGRDLPELIQDRFPPESEAREDLEDAIVYVLDRDRELLDEQGSIISAEETVIRALTYLGKEKGIDIGLESGRQTYVADEAEEQRLREVAIQELVNGGLTRREAEDRLQMMTRYEAESRLQATPYSGL